MFFFLVFFAHIDIDSSRITSIFNILIIKNKFREFL